jgi:hypothetical protein
VSVFYTVDTEVSLPGNKASGASMKLTIHVKLYHNFFTVHTWEQLYNLLYVLRVLIMQSMTHIIMFWQKQQHSVLLTAGS